MKIFTVREVVQSLGINRSQLYYWEEVGKIPPARRLSNGKRYYLPQDLEKIEEKLRNIKEGVNEHK
jgi:DNA-binding transcriptional MerR regulator